MTLDVTAAFGVFLAVAVWLLVRRRNLRQGDRYLTSSNRTATASQALLLLRHSVDPCPVREPLCGRCWVETAVGRVRARGASIGTAAGDACLPHVVATSVAIRLFG